MNLKLIYSLIFLTLFISCFNSSKKNNIEENVEINSNNKNCLYSVNLKKTKLIWSGYKTTDKIKVTGTLNKFKSSKIQNNNQYNSIKNLVEGLDFVVDLSSSTSGDEIRDLNLKNFFFKYIGQNWMLNGRFENFQNDSVDVIFNFFGLEKKIKLSTLYENDKLQLKGSVNLIKQLGLDKAYESISNKCYDLHKGPDGISKTWKEVEIHVKAPIIFTCN